MITTLPFLASAPLTFSLFTLHQVNKVNGRQKKKKTKDICCWTSHIKWSPTRVGSAEDCTTPPWENNSIKGMRWWKKNWFFFLLSYLSFFDLFYLSFQLGCKWRSSAESDQEWTEDLSETGIIISANQIRKCCHFPSLFLVITTFFLLLMPYTVMFVVIVVFICSWCCRSFSWVLCCRSMLVIGMTFLLCKTFCHWLCATKLSSLSSLP